MKWLNETLGFRAFEYDRTLRPPPLSSTHEKLCCIYFMPWVFCIKIDWVAIL